MSNAHSLNYVWPVYPLLTIIGDGGDHIHAFGHGEPALLGAGVGLESGLAQDNNLQDLAVAAFAFGKEDILPKLIFYDGSLFGLLPARLHHLWHIVVNDSLYGIGTEGRHDIIFRRVVAKASDS